MSRVYNFSAGPAVLPEEVLKEAADEMLDYRGSGMSVMEMSHRSKVYDNIIKEAEQDLRDLMNIPDIDKVVFNTFFIAAMKLKKPYIIGHSDGGIIALTLAARYPDIPGAIISCGANTSPKTMKPYFIIGVKFNNMLRHDKLNDMMLTLPDLTADMLGNITAPTYIVAGEHDIMWLSDTVYMHEKIPYSRIAIIKGAGHSTYMSHDGKQAYVLAKGFFDTL